MPESRYALEGEDLTIKTSIIEEILTLTRDVLITFMASLSHAEQIILSEEASVPFLKNVAVIKALLAAKAGGDTRDNDNKEDEQ